MQRKSANTSFLRVGQDSSKAIEITGSSNAGTIRTGKDSFSDNTAGIFMANTNGAIQFAVGDDNEADIFDPDYLNINEVNRLYYNNISEG